MPAGHEHLLVTGIVLGQIPDNVICLGLNFGNDSHEFSTGFWLPRCVLHFCGFGIELAQLIIRSHTCDVADVATYVGGAALGAILGATVMARAWLRPLENRNGNATGRLLVAIAAMVQVSIICLAALPANNQWVAPNSDSILWIPFQGQFMKPFGLACGQMMSSMLWYVTLAALAAVMVPSTNRAPIPW